MTIYIDIDYKCHTEPSLHRREFEVEFFDGKCRTFVEGYRYVPSGEQWTRSDGTIFRGEMIAPWRDYTQLAEAQAAYDEAKAAAQAEIDDMETALNKLGVE